MNKNLALCLTAFIGIASTVTGCRTTTEQPNGNNANRPATNTAVVIPNNANQPTEPGRATSTGGSLATPAETYQTGYAARKNKDIAGLKRVLAKDALEFIERVAKADKKTVEDELTTLMETPQAPTAEIRNEKITGDRAMLEYLGENGSWVKMDFVKEGSDWKITFPRAAKP